MNAPEMFVIGAFSVLIIVVIFNVYAKPWYDGYIIKRNRKMYDNGYQWAMGELRAGLHPEVVYSMTDDTFDTGPFDQGAHAAVKFWQDSGTVAFPEGSIERLNANVQRMLNRKD